MSSRLFSPSKRLSAIVISLRLFRVSAQNLESSTIFYPPSFPTGYPGPISGGIQAEINGHRLSTGAIVGVVMGLLVFFGLIIVAITLCCIHSRRKRQKNLSYQMNNLENGAKGIPSPVNNHYKHTAVSSAGVASTPASEGSRPLADSMNAPYQQHTGTVHPTVYQQQPGVVDGSGYQQGQQQIDPRYSVYNSPISPTGDYAFPDTASPPPAYVQPVPQPYLARNEYPSPETTIVSPVSPVPSAAETAMSPPQSRPDLVEMDSNTSLPNVSPMIATAVPVTRAHPVRMGAGAEGHSAAGGLNQNSEKWDHTND
jgi:hypothetical protein